MMKGGAGELALMVIEEAVERTGPRKVLGRSRGWTTS